MPWQALLNQDIEVCAVQLPGRGLRMEETPYTNFPSLIMALAEVVGVEDGMPFAFFGHSLGGLIAFELARHLQRHHRRMPKCLFVSGCDAPQFRIPSKSLHTLSDDELINALKDYNGTPPEVLANRELMELVLPTIRADFSLVEKYQYRPSQLLNIPMTVLQGRLDDHIRFDDAERWACETTGACRVHWFEGDHFFINSERQKVIDLLNGELAACLSGYVDAPQTHTASVAALSGGSPVAWNDTRSAFPEHLTIHQWFEEQARATPGHLALVFGNQRLTFAELNARANRLAHYLIDAGVKPDAYVALCLERSTEMIVGILGILKAGGAYVPLDPGYPADRLAYILEDTQPAMLLTQGRFADSLLSHGFPLLCLDSQWEDLAACPCADPPRRALPANLAYVIYTSGSTGRPKGVLIQHRSVVNFAHSHIHGIYRRLGEGKLHTSFSAPFVFDASVSELILLLDGHTLHIVPEEARRSPAELLAFFAENGIAAFDSSPAQLRYLVEHGAADRLPKIVVFGGEAIDAALWQRLKDIDTTHFFNAYGPTECTVDVVLCPLDDAPGRPVIGRPEANARIYVLDEYLEPVPAGVTGELYIAGEGLARGYLNRPDLTAEKFLPDPFNPQAGARMYRSGDRGRILSDGNLEYIGRVDDQVKVRGFRIEPGEIESVLQSHPGVTDAAVNVRMVEKAASLAAYVVRATSYRPLCVKGGESISVRQTLDLLPEGLFSAAYEIGVGSHSVALLGLPDAISVTDAQQREYRVFSLATQPYARADFDALHADAWPAYFQAAPVLKAHWESMYACFPQAQMRISEAAGDTIGVGNAVLLSWDGTSADLPQGWDGALSRALAESQRGVAPNTLVILAGIIDSRHKERKIAGLIVDAFKALAASLSLSRVLVALRPIAKTAYQAVPLEEYCTLKNEDGSLADGWLRLHCNAGGRVVGWEEKSQYVEGTVDQWEQWAGRRFFSSGKHFLPDTLAPVHVDMEKGTAQYYDPCIWVEHPLPVGQGGGAMLSAAEAKAIYAQHAIALPSRLLIIDGAALPEGGLNERNAGSVLSALNRFSERLLGAGEIRDYLSRQLPSYMLPSHFVFLDRLPVTISGKIDRKALPAPEAVQLHADDDYLPPSSKVERVLCEIWEDVLGRERIGIDDNFFAIGGDSILLIRVISKAAEAGIAFSAKDMFQYQAIGELAKHVKIADAAVAPPPSYLFG